LCSPQWGVWTPFESFSLTHFAPLRYSPPPLVVNSSRGPSCFFDPTVSFGCLQILTGLFPRRRGLSTFFRFLFPTLALLFTILCGLSFSTPDVPSYLFCLMGLLGTSRSPNLSPLHAPFSFFPPPFPLALVPPPTCFLFMIAISAIHRPPLLCYFPAKPQRVPCISLPFF